MAPLPPKEIKKIAVAVFVKTPGQSPLKTRLAKTIGEPAAHRFYLLACQTITETLKQATLASSGVVQPIWAVAEADCFPAWKDFPHIHQGEGDLGQKLHHVYSSLLSQYDAVMLIGADAPHLTRSCFLNTIRHHEQGARFVFGPASDGGFYLFSGSSPVPKSVWTENEYSSADTLSQLLPKLESIGKTEMLPKLTDVDVFADLPAMLRESEVTNSFGQKPEIYQFVKELIARHS